MNEKLGGYAGKRIAVRLPIACLLVSGGQKQQMLAKYSHGSCTTHLSLNRVDAQFRIVSFRHPTFSEFASCRISDVCLYMRTVSDGR